MDDLYDDLENYNDVNVVDELKKENKELKLKLDVYAVSMNKLQIDFDKLTTEYKTLEVNYSSLLKTARAEIERKTAIIKNLNLEKDMFILNSIQNKNIWNIKRNLAKKKDILRNVRESDSKIHKNYPNIFPGNSQQEKKSMNDKCLSSEDTVLSHTTDNTNKISNTSVDEMIDAKENVNHDLNKHDENKDKMIAGSIRNRRKSMPVLSHQNPKFCSDVESVDKYSAQKSTNTSREKLRRSPGRKNNDKYSNKTYKYSYQDTSRETYFKSKDTRYYDDRYRSRDKHEQYSRSRRQGTPEKYRRSQRGYVEDQYHRTESGRGRIIVTPPPDRYRQRSQDRRYHYNSDYLPEYDRYKQNNNEKHTVKHKIQDHCDELYGKRQRTDSYNSYEEENQRILKEDLERRTVPVLEEYSMTTDIHNVCCQSPDHIQVDNVVFAQPKEIMNTASAPLDDPRLMNNKYVLKKTDDNKEIISIVNSKVVDLKLVDKSLWNIPNVVKPKALQHPPQNIEDILKEVYMDIDNPACNVSIESGEINSSVWSDNSQLNNDNDNHDNESMKKQNNAVDHNVTIQEKQQDNNESMKKQNNAVDHNVTIQEKQQEKPFHSEKPLQANIGKYKIPKIKKTDNNTLQNTCRKVSENNTRVVMHSHSDNYTQNCEKLSKDEAVSLNFSVVEKVIKNVDHIDYNSVTTLDNKNSLSNTHSKLENEKQSSSKDIVENDLELSEEDDDNNKYQKSNSSEIILEPEDKKHKSKKRSCKLREESPKTLLEEAYIDDQIEKKKSKSKKEKDSQKINVESKFSELFGDSCSLITPEDLAIATEAAHGNSTKHYMAVFEDAQDAVDLNVEEMLKFQTRSKIKIDKTEENVNESSSNNKTDSKLKSKSAKANKLSEHKKKRSKKNDQEIINIDQETKQNGVETTKSDQKLVSCTTAVLGDNYKISNCEDTTESNKKEVQVPSEETIASIYKNINPNVTVDTDVVKTVVISSGVQPQCIQNNVMETENALENYQKQDDIAIKTVIPTALAMSTPCKSLQAGSPQTEVITIEPNSYNYSSSISNNNNSQILATGPSSTSNEVDTQNDVPDVRIFVRRRKVSKKQTSSVT